MTDPVMTPKEVAAELRSSVKTVRRHITSGELKAVKRGNKIYIRRSWVEEFLTPTSADVA